MGQEVWSLNCERWCSCESVHTWKTGERGASLPVIPRQVKAYVLLITFITEDPNKTYLFFSKEYTGEDRLN